jgi:hypothetical protein
MKTFCYIRFQVDGMLKLAHESHEPTYDTRRQDATQYVTITATAKPTRIYVAEAWQERRCDEAFKSETVKRHNNARKDDALGMRSLIRSSETETVCDENAELVSNSSD